MENTLLYFHVCYIFLKIRFFTVTMWETGTLSTNIFVQGQTSNDDKSPEFNSLLLFWTGPHRHNYGEKPCGHSAAIWKKPQTHSFKVMRENNVLMYKGYWGDH